jgi:hypothetical protein
MLLTLRHLQSSTYTCPTNGFTPPSLVITLTVARMETMPRKKHQEVTFASDLVSYRAFPFSALAESGYITDLDVS